MKIAFMVGTFPALSETFVLNQITTLIDLGHDVSIFAERRPADREIHPDVARYDLLRRVRYEDLPGGIADRILHLSAVAGATPAKLRSLDIARFGATAASLRLLWAAHWVEGAPDFDIIQCHFGALGLKAVLLREIGALRGKIVTAFHGVDITDYPRHFRGNVYAPLFAHGDLFLPISARWNDELVRMGCPANRIQVHRMAVDLRHFPRKPPATAAQPIRILTVGRLVEKKGIADALRAVATLHDQYEYTIAGDGPLRVQLATLAQSLGIGDKVHFAGACTRDQVAALLQRADVFLAPSVTGGDGDIEGMPVTIMEAMATGLPVISTRHSAIPELVADGTSGLLADERDIGTLSSHLSTLARDAGLRERMGGAGRAIVEREFDIRALTTRLAGLYEHLNAGAGSR